MSETPADSLARAVQASAHVKLTKSRREALQAVADGIVSFTPSPVKYPAGTWSISGHKVSSRAYEWLLHERLITHRINVSMYRTRNVTITAIGRSALSGEVSR